MAAPRKSAMQVPSSCHQGPQPQERDTPWEAFHRRFSQFQYEEAAGPRDAFCRLWELCFQWLKPQTRSVEQILAMMVTEKFLQILPADMENSARMRSLETRERLFTLIEELRRDNQEAANNVRTSGFVVFRPKQMPRQLRQDESFCPCHSTAPTLPQSPFQRCFL